MNLLLTNDDGIHAEGIRQLCEMAVSRGHRVTVCAPDRERSAASHAMTINRPVFAKRLADICGSPAYAVDGTPVDCAALGLAMLCDMPVDMTISGINHGPNLGSACIYSGTVNAAIEASMKGSPAIASSLCSFHSTDFSAAARLTLEVAEWALENPLPAGAVYNLNVPKGAYEALKGLKSAPPATQFLSPAVYEKRTSPYGGAYYWVADDANKQAPDAVCDQALTRNGYATLSVVSWNLDCPHLAPQTPPSPLPSQR